MEVHDQKRLLEIARKRVAAMDKMDGGSVSFDEVPHTAVLAILAGLAGALGNKIDGWLFSEGDLGCVLDAVVMLEQMRSKLEPGRTTVV